MDGNESVALVVEPEDFILSCIDYSLERGNITVDLGDGVTM